MHDTDVRHPNSALEARLRAIYGLRRGGRLELGFRAPYLELLHRLGDPQKKLPPVIHVAGTNGKGSVIAFMRGVLESEGYKTHTYTSPHLVRFNERIRLAGHLITDDRLEKALDTVMDCNAGGETTFFELTTALAFHVFAQEPADILLLETGLGGRLDCTNIVENPQATVITTISGDHTEFLGPTLRDIAGEKAGIIKPGRPCIVGRQTAAGLAAGVDTVFMEKARDLNALVFRCGVEWDARAEGAGMVFRFAGHETILPAPGLAGPHQIGNAGAALAALSVIHKDFPIGPEAFRKGLTAVEWPGRLQKITSGALAALLPPGWELWIDGGHNDSAGAALAGQARLWAQTDARPLHLIVGMMGSKHPEEFLLHLLPFIDSLGAVPIPGEAGCQSPEAILAAAGNIIKNNNAMKNKNLPCKEFPDPERVLQTLPKGGGPPGRILVTGSLYLVGAMLATEKPV